MLGWFVRGLSSDAIAKETGLHRKRVLRALGLVRTAMAAATGTLSPAGAAAAAASAEDAALPRPASAVYGLRQTGATSVAEVVPSLPRDVLQVVRAPPERRADMPPELQPYAAVGYRGRLYRLHPAADDRMRAGQLEAFWAYVRRQLTTKGGVRRERLGLYLAEYTWRYAHRAATPQAQVTQLLRLLQGAGWREWDYASAEDSGKPRR